MPYPYGLHTDSVAFSECRGYGRFIHWSLNKPKALLLSCLRLSLPGAIPQVLLEVPEHRIVGGWSASAIV